MAILNPTPEKLTQLRERVTRDCENCQGNPNWSVFAPSTCPDCMYGEPGKTTDPDVSVEEVLELIDEIERLRAKINQRERNDGCIMLTNFGRRCGKCNWCHNHPEEGGLDFYEDIK
jgi:hypothetical protein